MLNFQLTGVLSFSAATALGFASNAAADVVYPGPFAGTTVTYTDVIEASGDPGEDPEPLYGAPTGVSGDVLDFDPTSNFVADAPPTDTTDGSLSFTVTSNNALLTALVIAESGSYAFTGVDNDELVAATLQVQVLDTLTNATLTSQQVVFSEQYDTAPSELGTWSQSVSIDLTPFSVASVDVVVNNILQTTGTGPGTATITKSDFKINTPEPAAATLLAGLGAALLRRRSA
ncbi:MAG: hypothetical protein AAF328_11000 [Planctomycetota bacterium]